MFEKFKPNKITLSKEEIKKLNKKEFYKQFEAGNISSEDFCEFIKQIVPPKYNQTEHIKKSLKKAKGK